MSDYSVGHIWGMVGLIDVKRKESASVGYCVNYVTLNFDLTHDLDLEFFKVEFRNGCISGIVGLNQSDTGTTVWLCPLTTPMTLTLKFKGQSLKWPYPRNGTPDWHGTNGMWVLHSWPWYWPLCDHQKWNHWSLEMELSGYQWCRVTIMDHMSSFKMADEIKQKLGTWSVNNNSWVKYVSFGLDLKLMSVRWRYFSPFRRKLNFH